MEYVVRGGPEGFVNETRSWRTACVIGSGNGGGVRLCSALLCVERV